MPLSLIVQTQERLITYLASLGVLLGLPLYATADSWLTQLGAGSAIAICATLATTYFRFRGPTIKAQSDSRMAEAAMLAEATRSTLQMLRADLDYARRRADTAEQLAFTERQGKHAAAELLWAWVIHVRNLEDVLHDSHIPIPQGPDPAAAAKLLNQKDEAAAKLLTERAELTADAKKTQPLYPS